jgi:hypothetical protein
MEEFEDEWDICCERVVDFVGVLEAASTSARDDVSNKEPRPDRVIKTTTWKTNATVRNF